MGESQTKRVDRPGTRVVEEQESLRQLQESFQMLAQSSASAYAELLNSAIYLYQQSLMSVGQAAIQAVGLAAQQAQQGVQAASRPAQEALQAAQFATDPVHRAYHTLLEGRRALIEISGSGGLEEEKARKLALEAVRQARAETERVTDAAAPSPEEVRARRTALALASTP